MFWQKKKKGFPTFPVIVLVVAVLWFLSDLKVIAFEIPWLALIIGIIALGWVIGYYQK
ncbi:MAG: hypothetical protein KAT77_03240 [Nanoarchaeota archaeon]|nr:hypothetical protein [Nanoarchaeota archaeon]